jgi:ankyrin repeat protein
MKNFISIKLITIALSALSLTAFSMQLNENDLQKYHVYEDNGSLMWLADTEGRTPLHLAILRNQIASASQLIYLFPELLNTQDKYGNTPLHDAVGVDRLEMIEFMLDQGARVNIYNKKNKNPIDLALEWNSSQKATEIFCKMSKRTQNELSDFEIEFINKKCTTQKLILEIFKKRLLVKSLKEIALSKVTKLIKERKLIIDSGKNITQDLYDEINERLKNN